MTDQTELKDNTPVEAKDNSPVEAIVNNNNNNNNFIHLRELKKKNPKEIQDIAESYGVENPSSMLKQDLIFSILKKLAEQGGSIVGEGVLEVLGDGFGFLRSPEANYLAGPDDIYVSQSQIKL